MRLAVLPSGFGLSVRFVDRHSALSFWMPPSILDTTSIQYLLNGVKHFIHTSLNGCKQMLDDMGCLVYTFGMEKQKVSLQQRINMALGYRRMSQAALARAIGMTPSNFNQKFMRETFTLDEMEQIAEALGAKYVCGFEFGDGYKIGF